MHLLRVILLTTAVLCAANVQAYRILGILHTGAKSHHIVGSSLMKELARRGHQVTVISPFPLKKPMENYVDIETPRIKTAMDSECFEHNYTSVELEKETHYVIQQNTCDMDDNVNLLMIKQQWPIQCDNSSTCMYNVLIYIYNIYYTCMYAPKYISIVVDFVQDYKQTSAQIATYLSNLNNSKTATFNTFIKCDCLKMYVRVYTCVYVYATQVYLVTTLCLIINFLIFYEALIISIWTLYHTTQYS